MKHRFVVNGRASRVRYEATVAEIRRVLDGQDHLISSDPPPPVVEGDPGSVVVVGGDGTVNFVLNRCDPERIRLGVIPMGGANDLARELGIPSGIGPAWEVVREGRCERIDLIEVNGARFATCGGLGLATEVAAIAARWKSARGLPGLLARRLGVLIYLVATVVEVWRGHPAMNAVFEIDGRRRSERVSMVIVSNQPRLGGRFSASPGASNRDGSLHVCAVREARSRLRLLGICFQIFRGRPDRCPEAVQMRGRAGGIELDRVETFFGDGESLAVSKNFRMRVLPGALRVASGRLGRAGAADSHA